MRPRHALILAALFVWIVSAFIPFGRTLLYPFTLFATWVHEMGHGLGALAVGGRFDRLQIFADASGLAHIATAPGGPHAVAVASGLLGPPLLGGLILGLVHGPRRARVLLGGLAVALLVSLVVWVRSTTGWLVVPPLAALFGWVAWRGFATRPERRVLVAQVLGVLLAADTLTHTIPYLFSASPRADIATLGRILGGPPVVWGLLLTALVVAVLALGVRSAWRAGGGTAQRRSI